MTPAARPDPPGALLVDLYQLTMAQSYFAEGMHGLPATFSLFARSLPRGWGYLVAAGLDNVLAYLERLAFHPDELAYLEETRLFTGAFLDRLERLSFTGAVRALPEGTPFFASEPVLEVTAPVLEAQLAETVVLNTIHYQSLLAAKAARCVDVARGRTLVDFGLRRTHGADAGLRAARSSYLAGFDSTSNVLAGRLYGIPTAGTMAHSYVESFPDELAAFRAYARAYPDHAILLVDTYETINGVRGAVAVGRELAERGHRLRGVRLDSGDLGALAREARAILDEADLGDATVFASGGLDEHDVARLLANAPIDGFGIGSRLGTAADSPYLDMAYKLVEFDGRPVMKLSATKATLPGAKQVWRLPAGDEIALDVLGLELEEPPEGGDPLLVQVMEGGQRSWREPLDRSRARCARERARLPAPARTLDATPCEVELSGPLVALRDRVAAAARLAHGLGSSPQGGSARLPMTAAAPGARIQLRSRLRTPGGHQMKVKDVMVQDVLTVAPETSLKEVAAALAGRGVSGLPVVDGSGTVVGVVSEADILMKEREPAPRRSGIMGWLAGPPDPAELAKLDARTAGEAMTSPPLTVAPGESVARAAAMMVDEGVNRLPVVDGDRLIGIVTRADLVRAFTRDDQAIAREITEDVVLRKFWTAPENVSVGVEHGEVTLGGEVESRSVAELMAAFVERVPGVVSVDASQLSWHEDDRG